MSDKSIDKLAEQSEIERLKAVNAELLRACNLTLSTLRMYRNPTPEEKCAMSVLAAAMLLAHGR